MLVIVEELSFKSTETGKTYGDVFDYFILELLPRATAKLFREDSTEILLSDCKSEEEIECAIYEVAWVLNDEYQEAMAELQEYFFSKMIIPVEEGLWHLELSRSDWISEEELLYTVEEAKKIREYAVKG